MVDKHLDHSFGMLAVSFQLLTWCTSSAEDLIFFYLSQLMSIEIHNYCSFVALIDFTLSNARRF